VLKPHLAQHHLRVAREVLIDVYRPIQGVDGCKLAPGLAARGHAWAVFLQEEDVGGDFGTSVGLESGVGQTYGPDQVRAFGQVLPAGCILLVHRVPAGDERHHTASARLIERFGEEIIVDRTRNCRTAAISGIEHRIISKRNVANDGVKEVVRQGRLLKALGKDGCIGIEPLCDACCQAVEFHTGPAGARR
jgi:hypothetical protein